MPKTNRRNAAKQSRPTTNARHRRANPANGGRVLGHDRRLPVPHRVSGKNDHGTPKALYDYYDTLQGKCRFGLDAAAGKSNAKHKNFISEEENALTLEWITKTPKGSRVWLNPPYSHMGQFAARVVDQVRKYKFTVYMLCASRTDSRWWQELVIPNAAKVRCIKGRVKFDGQDNGAGFPSVVVVFTPNSIGEYSVRMVSDDLSPAQRGFLKPKKKGKTMKKAAKKAPAKAEAKGKKAPAKAPAKGKKGKY